MHRYLSYLPISKPSDDRSAGERPEYAEGVDGGKDEADRERDNDIAAGPRCGGVRECMTYKTGEYVHIRGGDFGAAGMEDVDQVGIARVKHYGDLQWVNSIIHGRQIMQRTPTPFTTRQRKLRSIIGRLSSQYCVIMPEPIIDSGARTMPPSVVARKRSSGHQTPPRRLRHETTM